jgi:Rrf2 family protein
MDMTLSKRGDYVMRSAICLARASKKGEGRKIREVVAETDVPKTFASQILADLVRAGLAASKAGREGGYRLARAPEDISVLEVVEAAEGPLRAERCALGAGPCRWDDVCPLHETWTAATDALRDLLSTTTLAALAERDEALEAGTYAVPTDAHRSRPLAVEVTDIVQVEESASMVQAALEQDSGLLGAVFSEAARDGSSADAASPSGRRSKASIARVEASLAPASAVRSDQDLAEYLIECRVEGADGIDWLEASLSLRPVDDERSEVRVEGTWHQDRHATRPLEASALERRARSVLRSFLRRLAQVLEDRPPRRSPRARPATRRTASRARAG